VKVKRNVWLYVYYCTSSCERRQCRVKQVII